MFWSRSTLLIAALFMQACQVQKNRLEGPRENVLLTDASLSPHPALAQCPVILDAPVRQTSWAQPGAGRTHAMHAALPQSQLAPLWQAKVGAPSGDTTRLLAPPILVEGVLYLLNTQGALVAHDAKTGAQLWQVHVLSPKGHGGLGGGVAFEKGVLYVTTPESEVVAVDRAQHKILWRSTLASPSRAAPTVDQGRLFITTIHNKVICLDAHNGQEIWQHDGGAEAAGLLGGANVAIADDIVIAPYMSGEVFGLDRETGDVYWSENLASFGRIDSIALLPHIHARPVVYKGVAYIVSHSGRTAAMDVHTGEILWNQNVGGAETPAVSGNTLFIVTSDQALVALDRQTGRVRWSIQLAQFEKPEKARGVIAWKGPILAGGKLIVSSSHGQMHLFDARTGALLQDITLPAGTSVDPIVVDETVYILTKKGHAVAYC